VSTLTPSRRRTGPFAPLRRRSFSRLFAGQLTSALGDQVFAVALPWTVLAATGDPIRVGLVLAAEAIPRVALLPLGGALADRVNPRIVMLVADIGRAAVVGAIGATLLYGLPPLWVIALLAGLQGAGSGLFLPGSQAIVPRTVEHEEISAANGLMQIILWLTMIIGPVIGGAAVAAQAAGAFFLDAITFVISSITLLGVRLRQTVSDPSSGVARGEGTFASSDLAVAGETRQDDLPAPEQMVTTLMTAAGPVVVQTPRTYRLVEVIEIVEIVEGSEVVEDVEDVKSISPAQTLPSPQEDQTNEDGADGVNGNRPVMPTIDETSSIAASASVGGISGIQVADSPSSPGVESEAVGAIASVSDTASRGLATEESERGEGLWSDIRAGLRYALGQPLTRATIIISILGNLAYTGTFGVTLVLLSRALNPSPITLGLLLGACGVGGILGGLAAGPIGRLRRRSLLILFLWLTMATAFLLIPIVAGAAASLPFPVDLQVVNFGEVTIGDVHLGVLNLGDLLATLSPAQRLEAIAALVGGISGVVAAGETVLITILQQRAPAELLARVFSVQFMAAGLTQPLSLVGAGLLAAVYGPGVAFIGAAALFFIAAVIGLATPAVRRA
jgi:MFS transporter